MLSGPERRLDAIGRNAYTFSKVYNKPPANTIKIQSPLTWRIKLIG